MLVSNAPIQYVNLPYRVCPCRERFTFKRNSQLHAYLKHSQGWVEDPKNKYTLNYIIVNLLVIAKERNFIFNPELTVNATIFCDDELQKAIGYTCFLLKEIRQIVLAHVELGDFTYYDAPPFLCVNESLLKSIFEPYYERRYVMQVCQNS